VGLADLYVWLDVRFVMDGLAAGIIQEQDSLDGIRYKIAAGSQKGPKSYGADNDEHLGSPQYARQYV